MNFPLPLQATARWMLLSWALMAPTAMAPAAMPPLDSLYSAPYVVEAGSLRVVLTPGGTISSIGVKNGWAKQVTGATTLDGCTLTARTAPARLPDGGVEFGRVFSQKQGMHNCLVVDRYIPDGQAVRWEVTIEGLDSAWSAGIVTRMVFPEFVHSRFWTPWGSPGHLSPADWGGEGTEWHTPFEPKPFRDMHLVYGGHFGKGAGYAIPVFSVMDSADGSGIALAMSPEDPLLELHMITTKEGGVDQIRRFHRIERGTTLRFTMHLFVHEIDWRAVLSFVVDRYPRFFRPLLKTAGSLGALGAYASQDLSFDADRYRRMGGLTNWVASFDFPYMGMFLPPVKTTTTRWKRFDVSSEGKPIPGKATFTSLAEMERYSREMKRMGFATLNYFNITEFGGSSSFGDSVLFPPPAFRPEETVWANPTAFLYSHFPGTILFSALDHPGWHIRTARQHMDSPVRLHDTPFWTWGGAIATDVGDSAYAEFLLDQARRHLEGIPDAQGICIDRLDWLNDYNWRADDGKSWLSGHPARSLLNSFRQFIPRLSALMHGSGKAIFCNPHMNRIELMEHFDGVFNEFGHIGHNLNLSAFLCLFKPLLCWTPDKATVMQSPDAFLQRHLLMGAFPTAPFPGNDHCLGPDPEVEQYYLDYGKMFAALRGREWILLPRVIETRGGTAGCNVFTRGLHELLIPVMHGTTDTAWVTLRHCHRLLDAPAVTLEILHPGEEASVQNTQIVRDDTLTFPVQLKRGCAFVVVKPA